MVTLLALASVEDINWNTYYIDIVEEINTSVDNPTYKIRKNIIDENDNESREIITSFKELHKAMREYYIHLQELKKDNYVQLLCAIPR